MKIDWLIVKLVLKSETIENVLLAFQVNLYFSTERYLVIFLHTANGRAIIFLHEHCRHFIPLLFLFHCSIFILLPFPPPIRSVSNSSFSTDEKSFDYFSPIISMLSHSDDHSVSVIVEKVSYCSNRCRLLPATNTLLISRNKRY